MSVKTTLLLCFMVLTLYLKAQEKEMKSSSFKKSKASTTAKPSQYYDQAEKQQNQPLEATKLIEKGLSIALDNNDVQAEIEAYKALGNVFKHNKQFDLAIENYLLVEKRQQSIATKQSPPFDEVHYDNLAYCYEKIEQYKLALPIRQRLEIWARSTGEVQKSQKYAEDVAYNLWKTGNHKDAITKYQELVSLKTISQNQQINIYNRMGDVYVELNQSKQAKLYYNKALALANNSTDDKLRSATTDKLSKVYRKEKDYQSEINLRAGQLAAPKSESSMEEMSSNSLKLGEVYLQQDKAEEAIPLLERSVELSKKSGNRENKKEALKFLSEAYAKSAQYNLALKYYKTYIALHDSLLAEKERRLSASVESYKDLSQQNSQISLLKKDMDLNKQTIANLQKEKQLNEANLKRQQIFIYGLTAAMIAMILLIYFIQKSNRQKRIANQLLALKSLRSQMNPHFIFNSLNSVNHYIMQNDERAANKYLSDFSKLMRAVMENSQEDFVSLNKEIEILTLYLKLEHQRFADKFDYELVIDSNIETEQFMIPPMLVQPYIENAIWHGLRYKPIKGWLSVQMKEVGDLLKITIEDNGIGSKKSQELKTKNQKENTSTGMRNTKERVAVMNELYHTQMQVNVIDLAHEGTRIEISIARRIVKI